MQFFQLQKEKLIAPDIYQTSFEGVLFLKRTQHSDQRGWYCELARIKELNQVLPQPFIVQQINLSNSQTKVARGFHAENWSKLITPLGGECLSVLADFRVNSPTYKQILAFKLGESDQENPEALNGSIFVPPGIGNSFLVTKGPLYYLYCVDALYKERDASGDLAISLFDPELEVEWPINKNEMIISERDLNSITLQQKITQNQN